MDFGKGRHRFRLDIRETRFVKPLGTLMPDSEFESRVTGALKQLKIPKAPSAIRRQITANEIHSVMRTVTFISAINPSPRFKVTTTSFPSRESRKLVELVATHQK
jgi:hypothetical protein